MKTNLKIKTYVSSNVGWSRISYKSAFLWIKGYFYNTNPKRILVALFEKQNNLSEIKKILNTIDGHYGLIYQNKNIAIITENIPTIIVEPNISCFESQVTFFIST